MTENKERKLIELQTYIDIEYLPYKIGIQKEYVMINSTHHPFEQKFLDKLEDIGFKITTIAYLKEIGQTVTCIEDMR